MMPGMFGWDPRQARVSLLLFLAVFTVGLVKIYLTRPIYPDSAVFDKVWPPGGCLLDATALKNKALEVFPQGTRILAAVAGLGLEVDPLGSGFCLPRAGVLFRGKEGWRVRNMTQPERWVWRIPMDIHLCGPEDLARISGIGPSLGGKIHRYMQEKRCLDSLNDLLEVPGIGPSRLAMLKGEVELE